MNMNMQAMLDQAFDAGREAERKMASIAARGGLVVSLPQNPTPAVAAPRTTVVESFAKHAGKAPVAHSTAKKAAGPRTKGVKEAILALLSSNPMSAGDIISSTGFKGTSVRATLMGIKKAGLAMNIDGQWVAVHHDGQGNSESEAHPS